MSYLFDPFTIRNVTFRNRIFVSPMCQYSSRNGLPNDWHLVHLGSRAVGGAALVMVEASAVSPEGRITDWDSGFWSSEHVRGFTPIARFIEEHGAVPGLQLAHAGRKASTDVPWRGGKPIRTGSHSWQPVAPSAIPFAEGWAVPSELTEPDIDKVVADFERAAAYAVEAGFRVIELHMAHGYLIHEFLSPLTNHRADAYGGSMEKRMRLALRVTEAVRKRWPEELPLFVRISATDWAEGGWDLEQSVALAKLLRVRGVDLIDCSSGGLIPNARVEVGPGYQVPFARIIRAEARVLTGAVGMITQAKQAEAIIAEGSADAVLMARKLLRDPYWPLHAARELGVELQWPPQYQRAKT
ncbi:MAG TPA: NADH:flavin oxidoreductase/NADH oxidase [Thermoanaerobaculia bacterium]|nr:NADH:flavin oxidoreductase/NADH oxidase [Thermoanaerobaculia bacterium]